MQVETKTIPSDLFVSRGKEIERILRLAVRDALIKHKRAGNPIAVWKDGKVAIIPPADISVDDRPDDGTV